MDDTACHPGLRRAARFLPRAAVGPRHLRLVRALTGLQARLPANGVEIGATGAVSARIHRPAQAASCP